MRRISILFATTAIVSPQLRGCAKNDSLTITEKKTGDKPSIAETKAIAEEAYIYGLPIVMNYAVMYQYAVDRNSGQFQAPFNHIFNERAAERHRVSEIRTVEMKH